MNTQTKIAIPPELDEVVTEAFTEWEQQPENEDFQYDGKWFTVNIRRTEGSWQVEVSKASGASYWKSTFDV